MKAGLYAEVGGREYRAGRLAPGVYRLFEESAARTVSAAEVERLWLYRAYACAGGVRAQIESEDAAGAQVGTTDAGVAEKLRLDAGERGTYRGFLPRGSYTVETEREAMVAR